jgi:hypothetical protein
MKEARYHPVDTSEHWGKAQRPSRKSRPLAEIVMAKQPVA